MDLILSETDIYFEIVTRQAQLVFSHRRRQFDPVCKDLQAKDYSTGRKHTDESISRGRNSRKYDTAELKS